MSDTPDISVVMSVFNAELHLATAVQSILGQRGAAFEFVIVNDGSTDGSTELLRSFAGQDERIRLIEQDNVGLTQSLVTACRSARGRFIARQDAHDISLPGRLRALQEHLDSKQHLAMASSWVEWIGPEDELLFVIKRPADPATATRELLHERMGPPAHGSVMFRRDAYELAGGYRPQFRYAQDADLWHRLGELGHIEYEQRVLYRYRYRLDGTSGKQRGLQRLYGNLEQACLKRRLAGNDDASLVRRAGRLGERKPRFRKSTEADAAYFLAECLHARGDQRARKYLVLAAKRAPWRLKTWFALARHRLRG